VLFATLITLLLVPVNYLLLENARAAYYRFIHGGELSGSERSGA